MRVSENEHKLVWLVYTGFLLCYSNHTSITHTSITLGLAYTLDPPELELSEGAVGSFSCDYNGALQVGFRWNDIPFIQLVPEGVTLSTDSRTLYITGRREHNGARVKCLATVQGLGEVCPSQEARITILEGLLICLLYYCNLSHCPL